MRILVALLAVLALLGDARAEVPAGRDALSAVGYVALIGGPKDDIVIMRKGRRIEVVAGTALLPGDQITIKGSEASLTLKIYGRPAPIVLPDQGSSMTIGGAPPPESVLDVVAGHLPAIGRLFTPDKIYGYETRPRGGNDSAQPLEPSGLLPPGRYFLSAEATRVSVFWHGTAASIELVARNGSVLASEATAGTSATLPLSKDTRDALGLIRARGADGHVLTWRIALAARAPAPRYIRPLASQAPDLAKVAQALWLAGFDPTPPAPPDDGAWRLEGFAELSALADRMFPAHQVLEAARHGDL